MKWKIQNCTKNIGGGEGNSNTITVWRIIFTYVIMSYHLLNSYRIQTGWYIGVEFFFLVSGFLLAKEYDKKRFSSNYQYTFYRIKKLFPHYFFSFLVGLLSYVIYQGYGLREIMKTAVESIYEASFLSMIGVNLTKMINVPTWYLSVLLIAGFFIYGLLVYNKEAFRYFIAPAAVILIYSYMYREVGCLQYSSLGENVVIGVYGNIPLFRGAADMICGVILYWIFMRISKTKWMLISGKIKNGLEIICYGSVLAGAYYFYNSRYDFIFLALLGLSVLISFSHPAAEYTKNRIILFMGKLSYPLFLNHNMFRIMFPKLIAIYEWKVMLIYFIIVTVYSVFTMLIVEKISRCIQKRFCPGEIQMKV